MLDRHAALQPEQRARTQTRPFAFRPPQSQANCYLSTHGRQTLLSRLDDSPRHCYSMETAGQTTLQESAVHARRQAACWWPSDTTACSLDLDDASTFSSSLLLGWDPQLCCFGSLHARDSELFGPTCRSRFACLQGLHCIPFPACSIHG